MTWATEEVRDQIAILLAEGLTGKQIAHRLGVTRNAAIGVIHRDKRLKAIGFKRSPGPQNIEKKRDLSIAAKRRRGGVRGGSVSLNKIKAIQAPAIVEMFDTVPDIPGRFGAPQVAGMPMWDDVRGRSMLTQHRCAWPLNDGGPFLFCGEVKRADRPYCAYHATAALGKGTESERTAVRSALKIAA